MKIFSPPTAAGVQRALAALALTTAASATMAATLPPFTFDPSAVGLNGTAVTADNIVISDYSAVTFGGGGSFNDTGYLSFSNFQLGSSFVNAPGLNSTYGLYIEFTGTGTITAGGDPTTTDTKGTFNTLTYTLYGFNGSPATFGFTAGSVPTINGVTGPLPGSTALATGELIAGKVSTTTLGDGTFVPTAGANLSFNAVAKDFFADPSPFYNLAFSVFSNTTTQVEAFDGGFRIRQGGGAINFGSATAPVPEPGTYALMLAGLAVVGTVVRRRRKS